MRYKFEARGSLIAYIEVKEDALFKIQDNIKLFIYKSSSSDKKFFLEGACEDIDVYEYIKKILNNFCFFLSFVFGAPVNHLTISSSSIEDLASPTVTTTKSLTMSYNIQGKSRIHASWSREKKEYLKHIVSTYSEAPLPIILFNKALNEESLYGKFWYFYNILQILIGDRVKIDGYLKIKYPELKLLHSDYQKKNVTITIAIRDSFSHLTTYNGKPLMLDKELAEHINNLQKITKDLLNKHFI